VLPRTERPDFTIVECWTRKYKVIPREKAEEALKHGVLGRPDDKGDYIRSIEEIPPEYDRDFVKHPGLPSGSIEVAWTDIDALRLNNLIEVRSNDISFILKPDAKALIDELKSPSSGPKCPELPVYKDEEQPWYCHLPHIECLKREGNLQFDPEVVILTAVPVERDAVLHRLNPITGQSSVIEVPMGYETYFLGSLGGHTIALTMCEMGYSGPASSMLATQEAIARWAPLAVIMGGIAFGMHPGRQRIADVLVSRIVHCYELQRVQENVTISRGDSPRAGLALVNRFSNVPGWRFDRPDGTVVDVKVGQLLSGEKLVDNPQFKAGLRKEYPEAIGGEMEGVGLYAAAMRAKVEWIIVKAICDWADGGKHKQYQPLAAAAAVSLIEHVLAKPNILTGLLRPPHHINLRKEEGYTSSILDEHDSKQGLNELSIQPFLKESESVGLNMPGAETPILPDEHDVALVVAAIEPDLRQLEEDNNFDEVNIMDAGTELTNRYLSLPHRLQIKIARNLELFREEDNDESDVEQFCRFFRRAKEQALLQQLWDKVEEVYISQGGSKFGKNPFSGR
jgi:nucleoside phosphorylase